MIDIHSHIMPGIDDGSRTINDSIKLLEYASKNRITDIILTPHYIKDSSYMANNEKKYQILNILKDEIKKNNININLYLGNEVFIDEDIVNLLKNEEITTLNKSRYLLIEFSMGYKPTMIDEVLDDLFSIGLIPIIAHPERYSYYYNNIEFFENLVERGCLLQSNLGSIYGIYGHHAKKMLKKLLKNNLISFIASDIHHIDSKFYSYNIEKDLYKIVKDKKVVNDLLINNQLKIINNEIIQ